LKLSENMLNFLGYLFEGDEVNSHEHWCPAWDAVALAYPFGIASAVENKLIEEFIWDGPGYRLTDRGKAIGKLGEDMRKYSGVKSGFIRHAQLLLDTDIL
jgi:hypothetical protein